MTESEDRYYDVEQRIIHEDPAKRLEQAVAKAGSLLFSWRSRHAPESAESRVAAEYDLPTKTHVTVESESKDRAHVTEILSDGSTRVYKFDAIAPILSIANSSDEPGRPVTDVMIFETFSRILFDCDRVELRRGEAS